MDSGKFILAGEDKKTLAGIKNALTSCGHIFLGHLKDAQGIVRHIRSCQPDFIIIEPGIGFKDLKETLSIIDEDLLAACILIFECKSNEISNFLKNSRIMTYTTKPVFDESILQIVDISLLNYQRVLEYEEKVKKLNNTLESRKFVDKAKWILIEKDGYTEAEAYEVIRKKSRDNRVPMRYIAEALIMTRGKNAV